MARPANLTDAKLALRAARNAYDSAFERLDKSKDYADASAIWKEGHDLALSLKKAHNGVYAFLAELKPKKADKLKPGGKLDNEPVKEPKKGGKKAAKAKRGKAAEAEKVAEAASDEPTDDTDDRDEP